MKYKIIEISRADAFFEDAPKLIGKVMDFMFVEDSAVPGYLWAETSGLVFYAVKLEPAE